MGKNKPLDKLVEKFDEFLKLEFLESLLSKNDYYNKYDIEKYNDLVKEYNMVLVNNKYVAQKVGLEGRELYPIESNASGNVKFLRVEGNFLKQVCLSKSIKTLISSQKGRISPIEFLFLKPNN